MRSLVLSPFFGKELGARIPTTSLFSGYTDIDAARHVKVDCTNAGSKRINGNYQSNHITTTEAVSL